MRGVSPILSLTFGLAPAAKSFSTRGSLPLDAANQSAVAPSSLDAFASAPASKRVCAISSLFR